MSCDFPADIKSLVSDLVHTRLAGGIPMSAASKDTQLNIVLHVAMPAAYLAVLGSLVHPLFPASPELISQCDPGSLVSLT